jgi:6,7-dimethyl-8-ribityllumazine synthase
MKVLEGKLTAEGLRVGIVAARFNEFITNKLVSGAIDALTRHGASEDNLTMAWVRELLKSLW